MKAIRPILPSDAEVKTAAQQVESDAADTNSFISFLRGFLLAFGGIALFVGLVRHRELALDHDRAAHAGARDSADARRLAAAGSRARSSSRRSSSASLASVVGLFFGLLLAKALFGLFDLVGFILPNTGLVFLTRTSVIVALARRHPRDADREPAACDPRDSRSPDRRRARGSVLPPPKHRRLRGVGAVLLAVAGIAAIAYGIFATVSGRSRS